MFDFRENLVINVEAIPLSQVQNTSLKQYVNQLLGYSKQNYQNFKIIEPIAETTFSNGYPAIKIAFTATYAGFTDIRGFEIYALQNNKIYNISYISHPEKYHYYLPKIQGMIDTFKIIR